jgi:hypothetical protein
MCLRNACILNSRSGHSIWMCPPAVWQIWLITRHIYYNCKTQLFFLQTYFFPLVMHW